MKSAGMFAALAFAIALVPSAAMADDPNDPDMRDPRNRARDRAIIKQMNLDQLAHVRARDARYAEGWKAYREAQNGGGSNADYSQARAEGNRERTEYARDRARHEQDRARHEQDRARHEQDMAAWRRAVAKCRAGHHEYCDG